MIQINADNMLESGHELLVNNMYAYCANNPINNDNPTSNFFICISIGFIAKASIAVLTTY